MQSVNVLGRWDVVLPEYRVEHYAQHSTWEEGRLRSMHAHLEPGMVLYDVGAEHGDLSALYATWLAGFGRLPDYDPENPGPHTSSPGGVVLIEGSESFWPVIRATFEANGLTPAGCWAGFASDHNTDPTLQTPSWSDPSWTEGGAWPDWAGPSLHGAEPTPHHGFKSVVESKDTIPNLTFDTITNLLWPRLPDALTIDVEGAEALVLRGSDRILGEARPLVWVSLHPQLLWFDYPEWDGMTADDVKPWFVEFMAEFGYRAYFLEDNHESHYLCLPDESTADPYLGVEHLRP